MMNAIERYKKATEEIVQRYVDREITFPQCVDELANILARAKRTFVPEDIVAVRDVMHANNDRALKELRKRQRRDKITKS